MPVDRNIAEALARRIAEGHAWEEHRDEFPDCAGRREFATIIAEILQRPTAERPLRRGRSAYWLAGSGTIVIVSPADPDGGTCFRPFDGKAYYANLR